MHRTVEDVMTDVMSSPVVTVGPGMPVKEVAALLVRHSISAVPVVDAAGTLLGIVSEADLVPLQAVPESRGRFQRFDELLRYLPRTAADAMTRDVVTLPEDADVAQAALLMLERAVKRIPVVRDGRATGIVSRRDLLRALARSDAEVRAEVEDLLNEEQLQLGGVDVSVAGGIVSLAGLAGAGGRRAAEILARSVPGVVAVTFADRPVSTR